MNMTHTAHREVSLPIGIITKLALIMYIMSCRRDDNSCVKDGLRGVLEEVGYRDAPVSN